MAEFKANMAFKEQITNLQLGADLLTPKPISENDPFSAEDLTTLPTATKIISQHTAISKLLAAYRELLSQDAKDLDTMLITAKQLDDIAASHYLR